MTLTNPNLAAIIIIICILCTGKVTADNGTVIDNNGITAEVGETWIKWSWNINEPITDIYIDYKLAKDNEIKSYYYLKDINPLEKHTLTLYNYTTTTIPLGSSTVTTLYPKPNIFFMIWVVIFLGIIMLLAKTPIKIILIGGLAIALAVYASTISIGYEGLYILPLILAILVAAYVIYALWDAIHGYTSWY